MLFKKKDKKEEPKKVKRPATRHIARTMQELFGVEGITESGIVVHGNEYSKMYEIVDYNYIAEPEDRQEELLASFIKLLNKFDANVTISLVVINKRNSLSELVKSYHLKDRGEHTDYIEAYNAIIDEKIKEGRNDIEKRMYFLLSLTASSLSDAESLFTTCDISMKEGLTVINRCGYKAVDGIARLSIMREILRGADVPFEKLYSEYINKVVTEDNEIIRNLDLKAMKKRGMTAGNIIAPDMLKRENKHFQLGEKRFLRSYCFRNIPPSLDSSFITKITDMPYEMVTVFCFRPQPRKKALATVRIANNNIKADYHKELRKAILPDESLLNEDLVEAQKNAAKTRHDVVVDGKKLYYLTTTISLIGDSEEELDFIEKQYTAKCEDATLAPSFLIGEQIKGLLSALTLGTRLVRDRLLTSDDLAAFNPFNIQEICDRNGHLYGINALSKTMVMYNRKTSGAANGLVFGQTGSGKSFITKGEIIPNYLEGEDDIIILDPENEYRLLADALGGVVIDIETKSDFHINPCDMAMEWDDAKADPLAEKCEYMVGLVESILGSRRECNVYEVNVIHRCTQRMYEDYVATMTERHNNNPNCPDIDTELCPTLEDFYNELMADGSGEAAKVAQAIQAYCVGVYNHFAHKTNIDVNNRLIVYNLSSLPDKMREMAMKVCLSNIWSRIVKNRYSNQRNKTHKAIWVYLDEFHLFFQTESSIETIKSYFKRVRKYNGIMTGITQDVADLLRNPEGQAIFNNTGFFIFLKQSPVGRSQIQQIWNVSNTLIEYTKEQPQGVGLIYNNIDLVPINYRIPNNNVLFELMSTDPNKTKGGSA